MHDKITIKKAAELTGIKDFTIRRAINKGYITAYKPSKEFYILESDLLEWANKKFEPKKIDK